MALRGPACTRTRSLALVAHAVGRDPTLVTRAGAVAATPRTPARGPCQPQAGRASAMGASPARGRTHSGAPGCARQALPAPSPLSGRLRLRHGTTDPAAAPAGLPVVAVPEPENRSLPPYSRETSSRDAPRTEILPNMEPAQGRGERREEDGRSSSREKRATAGHQRKQPGVG